ncbi:unnamed protein product, partial [Urochloa humidicola]
SRRRARIFALLADAPSRRHRAGLRSDRRLTRPSSERNPPARRPSTRLARPTGHRAMACPAAAAATARIGAPRGPSLWRSARGAIAGSASPRPSRPARDTRARASELQEAPPRPPSAGAAVPTHKVTVHDRQSGVVHEFVVPEDQYILHTAEAQDIRLPFACRHGCCTSCAVRIKSGQIRQPEALGISAELKDKGYALLCVGFPSGDVEVETQDEDEEST